MRIISLIIGLLMCGTISAQFAPAAGELGTTAIHKDSSSIVSWASEVVSFDRGPEDIINPEGILASFGLPAAAIGEAEGTSVDVVSLGDGGSIVLTFSYSIRNGDGNDFTVFENSFSDIYLEFAHVEVSSDGVRFVRIPSISNIPIAEQIATYGTCDPSLVHNLAGKYRQGYGTPFDLDDIEDSTGIDLEDVKFVKIIDVIGSIDPSFGTFDSQGNLINDPYKTDFESGGFDLDAVGVMNDNNPSAGIEGEVQTAISLYPNPSAGNVIIKGGALNSVRIYNVFGHLVQIEQSTNQIEMGWELANGIYILEIETTSGEKIRQKLQLMR